MNDLEARNVFRNPQRGDQVETIDNGTHVVLEAADARVTYVESNGQIREASREWWANVLVKSFRGYVRAKL